MNLPLPDWCKEEDYDALKNISNIAYEVLTGTLDMKRMFVGPTLEKILENIKNNEENNKKKIYLYSAHDINIGTFTRAHNFTGIPEIPDFGSAIIIETMKDQENHTYIQVNIFLYFHNICIKSTSSVIIHLSNKKMCFYIR